MHFEVQYLIELINLEYIWNATSLIIPNYIFFLNSSALHILVMLGHADVVKFMVDPGRLTDVNPELPFELHNRPNTPLGIAKENGDEDIFRIIRLSIIRNQRWKNICISFYPLYYIFLHILLFQIAYYLLSLNVNFTFYTFFSFKSLTIYLH